MSMEQFAALVGVSWQTVQQWENGKTAPKRARAEKVAAALGITVLELVSGLPGRESKTEEPSSFYQFKKLLSKDINEVVSIMQAIDQAGIGMILLFARQVLKERGKQSQTQ